MGAYLRTEINELVLVVLWDALSELLTLIYPALYKRFMVTYIEGKPILYVKLQKTLYVCIKEVLVFYEKLTSNLKRIGFVVNPYDPSVVNKIVNRKKSKVVCHMHYLKLSHEY